MTQDDALPDAEQPEGFFLSRGLKIPKDPKIIKGPRRIALKQGTYEGKECDAILKVVRRDDRVLELGAGIGYVSTLIAARRPVEKVLSYEANPDLLPYIARMHAANGIANVEVRNALLTPIDGGTLPFYVRRNFLASSLDYETKPEGVIATHQIPCHGAQRILNEEQPTVLVCDIEGAEASLLPSADWSCLRAAVLELHPQWIGAPGVNAVFQALFNAGLTYFPRASHGKVVAFRRDW